jgi:hypothetical protein
MREGDDFTLNDKSQESSLLIHGISFQRVKGSISADCVIGVMIMSFGFCKYLCLA